MGERSARRHGSQRRADGFSLIEAMIASLLLLIIVLGILPLFTRSIVNNVAGGEYSELANIARSRTEEFRKLPFSSVEMTIDPGSTAKVVEDYYSFDDHEWKDGAPPVAVPQILWVRSTTVRQYGVGALLDGVLTSAEALDGGSDPAFVHLKEIEVAITGGRRGVPGIGASRDMTLRMLKFK